VFRVYNIILSIGRASVFVMPCLSYIAQSICPYSLPELRRGSSEVDPTTHFRRPTSRNKLTDIKQPPTKFASVNAVLSTCRVLYDENACTV